MAKNNQKEKKENPLLMGLLSLFCGTVCFAIAKTHDLEIGFIFTIPGRIVFPILGTVLYLSSIFLFKEWFAQRKARKKNPND